MMDITRRTSGESERRKDSSDEERCQDAFCCGLYKATPKEVVKEGQVKQADTKTNLVHTDVSTCLTMTFVDTDGNKIGAHAVMGMKSNEFQKSIDDMVNKMRKKIGDRSGTLLIAGNIKEWNRQLTELDRIRSSSVPDSSRAAEASSKQCSRRSARCRSRLC